MSKARRGDRSIEQRAYEWAARNGEFSVADMQHSMRWSYWRSVQALNRLCYKGCMTRLGANHWYRRYRATDKPPEDMRGMAPGSLNALRAKMHKPKRFTPNPIATTALEQAWGFLPVSRVAPSNEPCVNNGGTVRPQESEAA